METRVRRYIGAFVICVTALFGRGAWAADYSHILQPGESIWTVSQLLLAEPRLWVRLQRYNGITRERALPPGTPIRIPLKWLKQENLNIEVVQITGKAFLYAGGAAQGQSLTPGQLLGSGDRMSTEANSHVELRLPGGSTLQVAPLSEFSVVAHRYTGTAITKFQFRMTRGRIESQVQRPADAASTYEIITPTAQLGVRGTQFRVSVAQAQQSSNAEVEEGVVRANNPTLRKSANIDLNEGFATIVRAGKAPLPPIAMLAAPDLSGLAGVELGPDIVYSFVPIAGAIAYRVVLVSQAPLAGVVSERVTNSAQLHLRGLAEGEYRLRVRAMDRLGIEGRDAKIVFRVRELSL